MLDQAALSVRTVLLPSASPGNVLVLAKMGAKVTAGRTKIMPQPPSSHFDLQKGVRATLGLYTSK